MAEEEFVFTTVQMQEGLVAVQAADKTLCLGNAKGGDQTDCASNRELRIARLYLELAIEQIDDRLSMHV